MTNTYKYLWLLCGCIGLIGAVHYFMTSTGILFVAIPFIACLIFRMLYVKSASEENDRRRKK